MTLDDIKNYLVANGMPDGGTTHIKATKVLDMPGQPDPNWLEGYQDAKAEMAELVDA